MDRREFNFLLVKMMGDERREDKLVFKDLKR